MDIDSLPHDVQFEFLLDLPYKDVRSYCEISKTSSGICNSRIFWDQKARRDFGIPLKIFAKYEPERQYRVLKNRYEEDPVALIPLLIEHSILSPLPDLLDRSDLLAVSYDSWGEPKVDLSPEFYPILLLASKNGIVAKYVIQYILKELSPHEDIMIFNNLVGTIYYEAIISDDPEVAKLAGKHYNINFDEFVYYDAMDHGNLEIVKYLHHTIGSEIGLFGEMKAVIESGNNEVIDYFDKLYPGTLDDSDFINDLVELYIRENNTPAFKTTLNIAGKVVDCDRAINIADEVNDNGIVEYLLGTPIYYS